MLNQLSSLMHFYMRQEGKEKDRYKKQEKYSLDNNQIKNFKESFFPKILSIVHFMISLLLDYVNFLENNAAVRDPLRKAHQSESDLSNIITTSMSLLHLS